MRALGILATCCLMLAALAGCAKTTALTEQNKEQIDQQLRNRVVALENPEPAGFHAASTSSVLATGVIFIPGVNTLAASAIAYGKGSAIIKENHIEDPAIEVSRQLASKLIKKYNLKRATGADDPTAQLVFSVHTVDWATIYFLSDANNYRTSIYFQARLYDKKTGQNILGGGCSYNPEYKDTDEAPKWDYLFENGAVGFKEEIKKAQSQCIDELQYKVFGL
jgi:hypothetical protein